MDGKACIERLPQVPGQSAPADSLESELMLLTRADVHIHQYRQNTLIGVPTVRFDRRYSLLGCVEQCKRRRAGLC